MPKNLNAIATIKNIKNLALDLRDWLTPSQQRLSLRGYESCFRGKTGLEIGGPSFLWRNAIPIYKWASRIDNYDFCEEAIRHDNGLGKHKFRYFLHKRGNQYSGNNFFDEQKPKTYDFVVLRDVLEHTANPLKMLSRIRRLTKDDGAIMVVTPNKLGTFDYARNYTKFRHLMLDFINDTQEDDMTHFEEIKDLMHDHAYPEYNTRQEMASIIDKNETLRRVHHHVFSLEVLARCCSEAGYRVVLATESVFPHTIVLGVKYRDQNLRHKPTTDSIMKYI